MPYYICEQGHVCYTAATGVEVRCPTCGRAARERPPAPAREPEPEPAADEDERLGAVAHAA